MARRERVGRHARARFGARQAGDKQGYADKSSSRSDRSWGALEQIAVVVGPTPTGPMEFRKSTRDLKEGTERKKRTRQ